MVAAGFIVWMLRRYPTQTLFCFAITMIMGGALGNVVDRALHGYVVDFLQFRFDILEPVFRGGYFPTFNLADSAITLGAFVLIADEIRRVKRGD
jgi:signal peptidase II